MNIIERAKAITLSPAATWQVIDGEQHDPQSLFVPYMLILAAIPAVSSFIGMSVIGIGGFGFTFRLPVAHGLAMMVTTYVLTLAMTFGLGWLASTLAPTFGGQSNLVQGLKLAVFATTPMLLAGILNILPLLGMLGLIAALYCLYLMYLGLPVLMKNPPEKTIGYMAVMVVVSIIAGIVLGVVSSMFTPGMAGMGRMGDASGMGNGDATISTPIGEIKINTNSNISKAKNTSAQPDTASSPTAGAGTDTAAITIKTPEGEIKFDAAKMEAFAKQMEEMAARMEKAKK